MRRSGIVIAFLAAVNAKVAPNRSIQLTGNGLVSAFPDSASVLVGVISVAPTAKDALEENSDTALSLIDVVKRIGVQPKGGLVIFLKN
jgi:uncharacterized protein YggE